jgi:hypothetical protein
MSALRSDFMPLFMYEVSKLQDPWKTLLHNLQTLSVSDMQSIIGSTALDITGVYVKGIQCTFEKIAQRSTNTDVSHFFYVLYGLVMTCQTGEVHPYMQKYMRVEWTKWIFSARVESSPAFVLACERSLKGVVEWMAEVMNDAKEWSPCLLPNARGDTALHFAVKRRQWDWAKWLIARGASPYIENHSGENAIMLTAPHHEHMNVFDVPKDTSWFHALHKALVHGCYDASWCVAMLDQGADVNQVELYDAPIDSLVVFAKHGMDMNLGPLPEDTSAEKLHLFFMYGRKPERWQRVLDAFEEFSWIRTLHNFFNHGSVDMPEIYKENIMARQCITEETRYIQHKLNPIVE